MNAKLKIILFQWNTFIDSLMKIIQGKTEIILFNISQDGNWMWINKNISNKISEVLEHKDYSCKCERENFVLHLCDSISDSQYNFFEESPQLKENSCIKKTVWGYNMRLWPIWHIYGPGY